MSSSGHTSEVARFTAGLRYEDIPANVVEFTQDLFQDWIGSALAGKGARPVVALENFARAMGPDSGSSEILVSRQRTSPLFAAMINAASSHVVEQDDLHNNSVLHPATVVFPPALAVAQALGSSGREFITATVAGYEAGIRVGESLGRSHYKVFHTTGTAGTLASAAAVASLLKLNVDQTVHAFGSAGTQAAGLWEFLRDGADSKQLHTAKAAADGLTAAYLAIEGFTGAANIMEGAQGMIAGMSSDGDPMRLNEALGSRWALLETSFKFHASCRHTHPAADAMLALMTENDLKLRDVDGVTAHVHQAAIDVLGSVIEPETIHQAKFCMGFVLALIADRRRAGVIDFNAQTLVDSDLREFSRKVKMELDASVDAAYPARWVGRVSIRTSDGRILENLCELPKGDPGNGLSREELNKKATILGQFSGAADESEMDSIIALVQKLAELPSMPQLLPHSGAG